MEQQTYTLRVASCVDMRAAEDTLRLSCLAVQGLVGDGGVRQRMDYWFCKDCRTIELSGDPAVIEPLAQIYTEFLSAEFGDDAFTITATLGPQTRSAA